jgi:hypothetical protein
MTMTNVRELLDQVAAKPPSPPDLGKAWRRSKMLRRRRRAVRIGGTLAATMAFAAVTAGILSRDSRTTLDVVAPPVSNDNETTTAPTTSNLAGQPGDTGDGLALDGGRIIIRPAPAGFALRDPDPAVSGTTDHEVLAYTFGAGGESFILAVHRGPGLGASLRDAPYRQSTLTSTRGRIYFEADVPDDPVIWRELVWAEGDDVIVFVNSTTLDFSRLAMLADTVAVVA